MSDYSTIKYTCKTNIVDNDTITQTLTEEGSAVVENISRYILNARDRQIKEALTKIGFMRWERTKDSQPKEHEKVLFLHSIKGRDKICFGVKSGAFWEDLTETEFDDQGDKGFVRVLWREVEWWCRINMPSNKQITGLKTHEEIGI